MATTKPQDIRAYWHHWWTLARQEDRAQALVVWGCVSTDDAPELACTNFDDLPEAIRATLLQYPLPDQRFDYHEVTSHDEIDPAWQYTDPAGHLHVYVGESVPTVRYVVDDEGTDEYPERGHLECRQCGARVVPGRKATRFRQYMPVAINPKPSPIFTCHSCRVTDLTEAPLQIGPRDGTWIHKTCGASICPACGADPDGQLLCQNCRSLVSRK